MNMKKIHYPNLNFVRSFAAFVVLFHHTEQLKSIHGYSNYWNVHIIQMLGKLGVDLFFVLSGFLITSLILVEKDAFEKIDIKKFLMRRVLKIWPLYFLVFFIALLLNFFVPALRVDSVFISPKDNFLANIILYITFLPHIQVFFIGPILYCVQAWSIGIEEYFYLFWPFVVNAFKIKGILIFILVFIALYVIAFKGIDHIVHIGSAHPGFFYKLSICMHEALKFDCLLIGGFFAILNLKFDVSKYLTNKFFQIFIYALEAYFVFSTRVPGNIYWEVHAVMFGLIIYNLVRLDTSIINMEYPIFNFLGKISYGIYMYHVLVVNILIVILYKIGVPYLLYPIMFASVVGVAWFSYNYYEKYFLTLKKTYQKIITG